MHKLVNDISRHCLEFYKAGKVHHLQHTYFPDSNNG